MKRAVLCLIAVASLAIYPIALVRSDEEAEKKKKADVQLGNFSVSLVVKDISASREFYEKLGFKVVAGAEKQKYLVMQNATSTIGLHQGRLEKNSLTFNPGWDRNAQTLPSYQDVRDIQRELKLRGLNPTVAVDESTTGPAFMTLIDPDGNPILIDQHVPRHR